MFVVRLIRYVHVRVHTHVLGVYVTNTASRVHVLGVYVTNTVSRAHVLGVYVINTV